MLGACNFLSFAIHRKLGARGGWEINKWALFNVSATRSIFKNGTMCKADMPHPGNIQEKTGRKLRDKSQLMFHG